MFACKYGSEPVNLKLMALYVIKKIRFVFYGILAGAILFATVYHLKTYVFSGEKQYTASAELYLEYADDVRLDNVYINDYTWGKLVLTDKAMDYAMEQMNTEVSKEFLAQAVSANLVSDVRFVTLTVTTNDPDLSVEIAQAYEKTLLYLGQEMVDIDKVTIYTDAVQATEVTEDNRIIRMAITGAVTGALIMFLAVLFSYVMDDSIFVPTSFEQRYGIPVLGVLFAHKENKTQEEEEWETDRLKAEAKRNNTKYEERKDFSRDVLYLNYKKVTENCSCVAITNLSVGTNVDYAFQVLEKVNKRVNKDYMIAVAKGEQTQEKEIKLFPMREGINEAPLTAVDCAKCDGTIVLVEYGSRNGRMMERAINFLEKQDCKVIGALIYDSDEWLFKVYNFGFRHKK